MRKLIYPLILLTGIMMAASLAMARDLVILHTNDTHSQIEPDSKGAGGILQRKAVIDSVRKSEKDVIVIDAGDGVQGSLYFKLFRGEVDYPLMDMVGYDIRIVGNHEFDNGLEELSSYLKKSPAEWLSANYDFSSTPAKGLVKPYTIRKIGGKKIGFIGVNIDPESLITAENYAGMGFRPAIETANRYASMLKKEKGVDLVVAVTHIGYDMDEKEDDMKLAAGSRDIDVIIGGHTHTLVNPDTPDKTPHFVNNLDGKPVLVTQLNKGGKYIGKIEIDLDELGDELPEYSLIPVTDRYPQSRLDSKMKAFLAPYKEIVDSINGQKLATVSEYMSGNSRTGRFPNWAADFGEWYGNLKLDSLRAEGLPVPQLDMAIMNVGGIRSSWAEGPLTKGEVLSTFPFSNKIVVLRLKGSDLIDAMRVAARKGGEAISSRARVVTDKDGQLKRMILNGREVVPDSVYTVASIDYLAWGNDDLRSLAEGEWIFTDDIEMSAAIIRYLTMLNEFGLPVESDPTHRFVKAIE